MVILGKQAAVIPFVVDTKMLQGTQSKVRNVRVRVIWPANEAECEYWLSL